uniref:Uncharacterized protein n=1 Tax=Zea mays TaxID=4577 RepID=B7ZXJ9_MAIZE|nr:unknown [Zea mays]
MRDQRVQLQLIVHAFLGEDGDVGLGLQAAEERPHDAPPEQQLQRRQAHLVAVPPQPQHDRLALPHLGASEGVGHHRRHADALEAVVHAAAGHLNDHLYDGTLVQLRWIDEVCDAERSPYFLLVRVEINADDLGCATHFRALDHRQTDRSEAKDCNSGSWLHLGRPPRCSYPGAGAAAEEAGELGRHGGVDLDHLVHVHDGVLAEAGDGEEVVQRAPPRVPEPGGAVAPHPGADDERHRVAHVAVLRRAAGAALALPQERRHHGVPRREALHVLPHALHYPVRLMP